MLLENIVGDPQAEAGAGSITLGREEGLEYARAILAGDSAASVGDCNTDAGPAAALGAAHFTNAHMNLPARL